MTINKAIRNYLDHGRGNRKVRISKTNKVTVYGSPCDTDRSRDFWAYGGDYAQLAMEASYGDTHNY